MFTSTTMSSTTMTSSISPTAEPAVVECKQNEFRCSNGRTCIYSYKVCDGFKDCFDMSDEADCQGIGIP